MLRYNDNKYQVKGMLMCGRYYVDDSTAREIEKLVRQVDENLRRAHSASLTLQAGDIHPTEMAPILTADDHKLSCRWQRWGFPGFEPKQVIFNARSESVLEKRMFRESAEHRRIVVPAAGFYEWSRNKEKNIFYREEQPVLFMAGIYERCQNEERFVILTTAANESMSPVHDRMPLILEPDEVIPWIYDRGRTGGLLHKIPCLLKRRTENEQLSLFSMLSE